MLSYGPPMVEPSRREAASAGNSMMVPMPILSDRRLVQRHTH